MPISTVEMIQVRRAHWRRIDNLLEVKGNFFVNKWVASDLKHQNLSMRGQWGVDVSNSPQLHCWITQNAALNTEGA